MWLDDDRAYAYALADIEDEKCPGGCGQPLHESTAFGADDDYDVKVTTCFACAARQRRLEDSHIEGALVSVIRTRRSDDLTTPLPVPGDERN